MPVNNLKIRQQNPLTLTGDLKNGIPEHEICKYDLFLLNLLYVCEQYFLGNNILILIRLKLKGSKKSNS